MVWGSTGVYWVIWGLGEGFWNYGFLKFGDILGVDPDFEKLFPNVHTVQYSVKEKIKLQKYHYRDSWLVRQKDEIFCLHEMSTAISNTCVTMTMYSAILLQPTVYESSGIYA